MKMTFKEWMNKFHPECEGDMMEEQLMEEYATWQNHTATPCAPSVRQEKCRNRPTWMEFYNM